MIPKRRRKKKFYNPHYNITPAEHIRKIIWKKIYKRDQDCFWIFTGERGAGKSTSALHWALKLDVDKEGKTRFYLPSEMVPRGFKLAKGEKLPRVVFRASDFIRLITDFDLPKGSVIVWDEISVGISSRDAMSKINKMLVKTMETIRSKNLIVIGTTPVLNSFDTGVKRSLNFYAEARGLVNHDGEKFCKNQVYEIQTNSKTGKIYNKFLRYRDRRLGLVKKIGHVYIPKVPYRVERLYKRYKRFFQKELYSGFQRDLHAVEEYLGESKKQDVHEMEEWMRKVSKSPEAYFDFEKKKFVAPALKQGLKLRSSSQAKELKDLLDFKLKQGEIILEEAET